MEGVPVDSVSLLLALPIHCLAIPSLRKAWSILLIRTQPSVFNHSLALCLATSGKIG